jgi:cytochrome P450
MDQTVTSAVPAHVPPQLVFEFDFYAAGKELADPIAFWESLDTQGAPPIFYTPLRGGHWVFRNYDDVREIYRNWKQFSSFKKTIPLVDTYPLLMPQGIDPPGHQKYRAMINPLFTQEAIGRLEGRIRAATGQLLDQFVAKGNCDFVADFAEKLPTTIFLEIMGLPKERLPEFLQWEFDFFRGTEESARRVLGTIWQYLDGFLSEKRASGELGDDIIGTLLRARQLDGTPYPQSDLVSCSFLLFLAGLDTVTATMAFIWRYLADHPEARKLIIEHPDQLGTIVEELLRVSAVATLSRRVQFDSVYKGIKLKHNDPILVPNCVANRDPKVFDNPDEVDLKRVDNPHLTFGAGVHGCIGAHLAKTDIMTALRMWLAVIPDFTLDPDTTLRGVAGHVLGFRALPLVWKA